MICPKCKKDVPEVEIKTYNGICENCRVDIGIGWSSSGNNVVKDRRSERQKEGAKEDLK